MSTIKDVFRKQLRLFQINEMTRRPEVRWFLQNVPQPHRVLDICGGFGLWMFMMKQRGYSFDYVCIDASPQYCSEGIQLSHKLGYRDNQFINQDVNTRINLQSSFDQVWMFGWWPCNGGKELFDQVKRLLLPGGVLMINWREKDLPLFNDFIIENTQFIEGYGRNPFDFYVSRMKKK